MKTSLNLDPLLTFPDGSQLVVRTQKSDDGSFTCELFLARFKWDDQLDLASISGEFKGTSSWMAQGCAYRTAQRIYPQMTDQIKKPPYLIWYKP